MALFVARMKRMAWLTQETKELGQPLGIALSPMVKHAIHVDDEVGDIGQ